MPTERPLIELDGVHKAFGDKVVLDGVSLAVARGEALVVLGGSGSGKSVILRMVMGLLRPDAGAVRFDGVDLAQLDERALLAIRRRIAMLFQSGALFDSKTVGDNVAYPLSHRPGKRSRAEIARQVAEALRLVGLEGTEALEPAALSGGMRKRVALARALVTAPEAVLYDEPTTGLDPANTRRVCELMRSAQVRLGVTSIVVTHDLAGAFFVGDRVALLKQGRIAAELAPADFRASRDPDVRAFLDAMPASAPAP